VPLQPKTYPTFEINATGFEMVDDPTGPAFKHSDQSIVYKVKNQKDELFALKVFSLAYRSPQIYHQAKKIINYKNLPGLKACQRTIIKPIDHPELATRFPELRYAALMPWVPGRTWMEVIRNQEELSNDQIWNTAQSLALCLWKMSHAGIAHCQLNADNLLINLQENAAASVEFCDLEGLYAADLEEPEFLEVNQPEYCHPSLIEGIWNPNADRVAGAILLSEILTWNNPQVREALVTERSTNNRQISIREERFFLMQKALKESRGASISGLFEQAWRSGKIEECPTFDEWAKELCIELQFFEAQGDKIIISKVGGVTADLLTNAEDSFSDKDIEIEETTVSHNAIEVVQRNLGRNLNGQQEHKQEQNLKQTTNNFAWLWFVAVFFIILLIAIIINRGNRIDNVFQRTAIMESKIKATAEVHRTATAMAIKTAEAKRTATAIAHATATVASRNLIIADLEARKYLLIGPKSGILEHNEDEYVETYRIADEVTNFVLEADFRNPYSSTYHDWDHGILFRDVGKNEQFRIILLSNKHWALIDHSSESTSFINDGDLRNLKLGADDKNHIKLIAYEEQGFLFLNNEFVSTLDLSGRLKAGSISLATGLYNGDELNGKNTGFENVRLWNIENAHGSAINNKCDQDYQDVQIANHFLSTDYRPDYVVSYKNIHGWPIAKYQLSIIKNEEKSSAVCSISEQLKDCKINDKDSTILDCSPVTLNPNVSDKRGFISWCAFDAYLITPPCGQIFHHHYSHSFEQ